MVTVEEPRKDHRSTLPVECTYLGLSMACAKHPKFIECRHIACWESIKPKH
jgi:hypothetical protein